MRQMSASVLHPQVHPENDLAIASSQVWNLPRDYSFERSHACLKLNQRYFRGCLPSHPDVNLRSTWPNRSDDPSPISIRAPENFMEEAPSHCEAILAIVTSTADDSAELKSLKSAGLKSNKNHLPSLVFARPAGAVDPIWVEDPPRASLTGATQPTLAPPSHDAPCNAGRSEPPAAPGKPPPRQHALSRAGSPAPPRLPQNPSRAPPRGHPFCGAALRVGGLSGSAPHPLYAVAHRARPGAPGLCWSASQPPPPATRGVPAPGPPPRRAADAPPQIVLSAPGSSPVWADSARRRRPPRRATLVPSLAGDAWRAPCRPASTAGAGTRFAPPTQRTRAWRLTGDTGAVGRRCRGRGRRPTHRLGAGVVASPPLSQTCKAAADAAAPTTRGRSPAQRRSLWRPSPLSGPPRSGADGTRRA